MINSSPRRFRLISIVHIALFLFLPALLPAEMFKFHPAFSDNMVLQRQMPVSLFGKGRPGAAVTVSWNTQSVTTTVTPVGVWKVVLAPLAASAEPGTLTATSENEKITCTNVLVGDVWFCSGQSNMLNAFSTYSQLKDSVALLGRPLVRLYQTTRESSQQPEGEPLAPTKKIEASSNQWHESTPEFLINASPVAYFFAAKVSEELNVPVGILVSAWGGTQIESWMPRETLETLAVKPEFDQPNPRQPNPNRTKEPSILYNSMIHPFIGLSFKGFLWYQGESNSKWPENYKLFFPAMIQGWRERFQAADRPFYFVQLASLNSLPWDITGGESWAWIREAQMSALSLPKTGMTVITDLGEYSDIHPQNKKPVGQRLALFALRDAGLPVNPESPHFDTMQIKGGRCLIYFKNNASGLEARRVVMNKKRDQPIQEDPEAFIVNPDSIKGFTVCGPDHKFVEAQAMIVGDHVEVWSESVLNPVAVRYAWKSFPLCNLFSKEGLPVAPFRTDSFPMPVLFEPKTEKKPRAE